MHPTTCSWVQVALTLHGFTLHDPHFTRGLYFFQMDSHSMRYHKSNFALLDRELLDMFNKFHSRNIKPKNPNLTTQFGQNYQIENNPISLYHNIMEGPKLENADFVSDIFLPITIFLILAVIVKLLLTYKAKIFDCGEENNKCECIQCSNKP